MDMHKIDEKTANGILKDALILTTCPENPDTIIIYKVEKADGFTFPSEQQVDYDIRANVISYDLNKNIVQAHNGKYKRFVFNKIAPIDIVQFKEFVKLIDPYSNDEISYSILMKQNVHWIKYQTQLAIFQALHVKKWKVLSKTKLKEIAFQADNLLSKTIIDSEIAPCAYSTPIHEWLEECHWFDKNLNLMNQFFSILGRKVHFRKIIGAEDDQYKQLTLENLLD